MPVQMSATTENESRSRVPRGARLILIVVSAISILAAWAGPAAASPGVGFSAKLDGRDLATISDSDPLRLQPDQQVVVDLTVTNHSNRPVTVRSVNLSGHVMGLTFYSFETEIGLVVAPGATDSRTFAIQLLGLKGQATGLLPSGLDLLDQRRHVVASHGFAANVEGAPTSVLGMFGLFVAAISALLLLAALTRLASHRLSIHRWSRAVYFAAPGLGIGLTLTFSLAAFRILLPKASSWLPIVLVSTVVLFVIGYLTPTPLHDSYDNERPIPADGPERAAATTFVR
jgi:hypothetical protein